ncbi:MAG: flagellar basal body L-ring protein FlgH [Deltaproteobacteria bacterium]|nr:flagellar basal body L-ring protein FlgH [Deltaproteobacteria bacterium]
MKRAKEFNRIGQVVRDFLFLALTFPWAFVVFGCKTPEPVKLDPLKIAVASKPLPATAGSIWPGETSRNSLFQDMRARQVGDIVTVEISEKTSAIKEASTSTSRKAVDDIAIAKMLGLPLDLKIKNFLSAGNPFSPEVSSSYDSKFDGAGTTKRSGELSATIATRVVDILANGNMILEGKKDTIVNNEAQYIVLTGIVRPEDIMDNNTVTSNLLSDARIEYSGKGVLADEQSPGWLRRLLDNVWPF